MRCEFCTDEGAKPVGKLVLCNACKEDLLNDGRPEEHNEDL